MAGGKLSARQKMINMMYLVLTALLALNVSKEILDAFISIDEGQLNTRSSLETKLDQQMGNFSALARENAEKYGDPYKVAEKVQKDADEIISHINGIKAQMISLIEGREVGEVLEGDTVLGIRYLNSKDNYDIPTEIMYGSEKDPSEGPCERCDGNDFSALTLKKKLISFKESIQNSMPPSPNDDNDEKLKDSLDELFSFEDAKDASGDLRNWEYTNFNSVPVAGVLSILSKLQSDVRAAQSDVIGYLFSDVEKASFKFTDLTDAVIPQARTVTSGSSYEADVFLAAYDAQNAPEIRLAKPGVKVDTVLLEINGEYDILPMEGTKGKVKIPAAGLGQQMREGVIIFKPVGLDPVKEYFKLDYNVIAPELVVSPLKMNVFYKGVDNPVSVSVPGFKPADISASISNGTMSKQGDGTYIVRVSSGTETSVNCAVKLPDGSSRSLPGSKFRVKAVPDPVAQFAGKGTSDSTVKKAQLTAAQGVVAKMKDFDFDLKFTVTQFKVAMTVGGQYVEQISKSNRVTADMKTMLSKAKRGQKVYIEGIKAKGPDGTIRNLGALALKVN